MIRIALSLLCGAAALLAAGAAIAADVAATATLERGRILSRSDFEVFPAPNEDPAVIEQDYIGKQLTRTVFAGTEITARYLREPLMVERNDIVVMSYRIGTLTITTHGRALGEGSHGEMIQVLNEESKKRVQAIITGPDQVSVE